MINTEHWNSVVNYGSEFLQIPYLSVLEKKRPDNMRFHYVIIYNDKKPVTIAYFQVVNYSSESFEKFIGQDNSEFSCLITDYIKKHLTDHLKRGANKTNIRLLICGNTFISGAHGFSCIPEMNKVIVIEVFEKIIADINKTEKQYGKIAAVLMKDFTASTKEMADEFKKLKYHNFLVDPNMILDISWKTFDEYLNAMSKKYRHRAKSIVKKGLEIERKCFSVQDIKDNASQIEILYNNVYLKAKFRMASLSVDYFSEMKKVLGDKFTFVAYYQNEKIIGFKTTFILKNAIEAHFVGLNYEVNKEVELYQNILYDYVKEAIGNNVQQLFLGRTASEIKSTIGAESQELMCYIRHRNPFSNRIIKPFIDYLKPEDWIPRSPFKEVIPILNINV